MRPTDGRLSGKYSSRWSEPARCARSLAAMTVARVLGGESLDTALPAAQQELAAAPDRALLQAMSYGVLRDLRLIETLAARLIDKPLKQSDVKLRALILVGLYQLRSMRVPEHAAVSETVAATQRIGHEAARGLVNAVLRRYQRERTQLEDTLRDVAPAVRESHPDWLVAHLRRDWPDYWQDILGANNIPGPLTLRINQRKVTRADYLEQLQAAGLIGHASDFCDAGIVLEQAVPVELLPGFRDGLVSVQDLAAQLAAPLLDLVPAPSQLQEQPVKRLRILDACAAPGGKTAHMLEQSADIEVVALDKSAPRLKRVEENLARLGLQAQQLAADAADTASWWDGKYFDRILLDAPCSGTGVIRRHPDIKWLRRDSDIETLAAQQARLLEGLWPLLAPGGRLLYASCSVIAEEGALQLQAFLRNHDDAREQRIEAVWGEACTVGRRIRPGQDGMDGFYYCCLVKRAV